VLVLTIEWSYYVHGTNTIIKVMLCFTDTSLYIYTYDIFFLWTGQKQESACLPRRITATRPRQTFPALRPPVLILCIRKIPEILYGTIQKATLFRVSLFSFLLWTQIILWRLTVGVKLKATRQLGTQSKRRKNNIKTDLGEK